jgi:nucleotide-binding universal stress UspA family protein
MIREQQPDRMNEAGMSILVATDFSVRSDRALRRASLIARKLGARLTLVHVVDADRPQSLIEADRNAATGVLGELAQSLREVDQIETDWLVVDDDIYAGILRAADETSAELIVIGPHRSRWSDVFVGTTAERVVRRSTRPLLVAVDVPSAPYRATLLALDFDDASKFAARRALAMGLFDYTDVVVMHAFDAPAENHLKRALEPSPGVAEYVRSEGRTAREDLKELLTELDLPPSAQTVTSIKGSPARTIIDAAQQLDCDLIVLGTNQRKGFERALVGSVTADVIRDAHRDVLIIPVDAEPTRQSSGVDNGAKSTI